MATITTPVLQVARASVRCALFGHKVHHTRITSDACAPCARCGTAILGQGNGVSRVARTLSCFFGKHHYDPIAARAGHREYVCGKCGHPLLIEVARSPSVIGVFEKRVNYSCGLFGHRVHVVATRRRRIPWHVRAKNSTRDFVAATIRQQATSDSDGKAVMSKGGAFVSRMPGDPTTNW